MSSIPLRSRSEFDLYMQARAHRLVFHAKRKGLLIPLESCDMCGSTRRICAHHWRGYDYPLDVWWLCWQCNIRLDYHDGSLTKEQARIYLKSAYTPPVDQEQSSPLPVYYIPRLRKRLKKTTPTHSDQSIIDHLVLTLREDQDINHWQVGCQAMREHPLFERWKRMTDNQRRKLIRYALKQIR